MTDRLDAYRKRFTASYCTDDVVERSIVARRVGKHPALAAPYGREHPLDTLTDRIWSAMIRVACFVGKFITAAAIGIILGRLFT